MTATTRLHNVLVGSSIAVVLILAATLGSPLHADTKVKSVRMTADQAAITDGAELFQSVCASCHGKTATGDGPAAPALKGMPADLTALSQHNHGEFPTARVQATLQGKGSKAHGSEEMPMWGEIFKHTGNDSQAALRIANLVHYLKSIQVK
ncbi:MAG: cytochrome c [Bryobacterales bacterium]